MASNEKYFTISGKSDMSGYPFFARFGFNLISINRPGNPDEEMKIQKAAVAWHENLFRSISIEYRNTIQLNLKYLFVKGDSVQCNLFFTVFADTEKKMKSIVANIEHDMTPFFSSDVDDDNSPYLFSQITNMDLLAKATDFSNKYFHTLFFRQQVKIKSYAGIGFTQQTNMGADKNKANPPAELFPLTDEFNFDNELFRALLNQKDYAEIDIELKPQSFTDDEFTFIKQVIKNPSVLNDSGKSINDVLAYTEYLRKFVKARNDKFIISVLLTTESKNWEQFLKTSVQKYFFGSQSKIKSELRDPVSLLRYSNKIGAKSKLPFFYSIDNAIRTFRLPMPSLQDIPGIMAQNFIFQQVPKEISCGEVLIGKKQTVNGQIDIKLSKQSLARHLYIMGQTGTGKSTLLKTMITDCLNNNDGFTVIDPHGDLFTDIIKLIPDEKKHKLFILNPTDAQNPLSINPLNVDESNPQTKSLIINELIRAISSLYDLKIMGGPMFETYFKNGLLLIMNGKVSHRFGQLNLKDLCNMFYNDDFRKALLAECDDKNVISFFRKAELSTGESTFNNFVLYITSKLTRFVDDYYLEPILNGKKENIDFRKLIDEGNILLVKMDKGKLGADNTSLLGQIVLSNLFLAGMSRTDMEKENRKPYYIFIDEFQNFLRSDVGTALSEMRKYRVTLILANQTLGQLDNYLVESVLGNVGNLIFFRPGINDYHKIQHYFEPEFSRQDVLRLPNFNCIARLMMNNIPSEPFVFQTIYE